MKEMRRKLITLITFLSLFTTCFGQSGNNRGYKLMSMTTEILELKNDSLQQTKKIISEYDKKGNLIAETFLNSDNSVKSKETYLLNAHGDIIETDEFGQDGIFIKKTVTVYDSFHDKKSELVYDANQKLLQQTKFVYDAFGQKTEENVYDGDGALLKKIMYSYDAKGSLISKIVFNPAGEIISKRIFTYQYKP